MNERLIRFGKEKNRVTLSISSELAGKSRVRVWPMWVVLFAVLMTLLFRLGQLTLVEGAYFNKRAENNRVVSVKTTAVRGVFLDRNGIPLVRNLPVYKRQVKGTTIYEGKFEEMSRDDVLKSSGDDSARVVFDLKREYLCKEACANLLGYMGRVSEEELQVTSYKLQESLDLDDSIGKLGLEKAFEGIIRGAPGSQYLEVDAGGKVVRVIGEKAAKAGMDIKLTIDMDLQNEAYNTFEGKKGALILQEVRTGEILALVSSPSFNVDNLAEAVANVEKPFFNRAIYGVYPPGSTFKVVTATAGLMEGKIDESTLFEDTGEIKVGDYSYGNWYFEEHGMTEGSIAVEKALSRSNDIFFYHVGELLGADKLAEWAERFGLGKSLGLEELNPAVGLVPNPAWKNRYKGERWYLGNTYHMSIGQGDLLVTPYQINQMMMGMANNGLLCPGKIIKDGKQESCLQLGLNERTIETVRNGLRGACEAGGTGAPFFSFSPGVGCKTGTAQQGGEQSEPHAWFTAYAPFDKPEVVVTVLVEEGGQGSQVAAPIAKKVLEFYFLNHN